MTASNVLPMPDQGIAVYNEFKAQLQELKATNAATVFDYESKEGNKAARSYIRKLRSTKTAVDEARKEEKAASLNYGRRVDAEAKEIITQIEDMIDVHQSIVDEIEARETKRVEALKQRFERITILGAAVAPLSNLQAAFDELTKIQVDESFAEFEEEVRIAYGASYQKLNSLIEAEKRIELERAELEALRQEKLDRDAKDAADKAEKERAEREEEIRKLAEQKARLQAQSAAIEAQAAAAKHEEELKAAVARAEQQAKEAVEREQKRVKDEQDAQAAINAKRVADEAHRTRLIDETVKAIDAMINQTLDCNALVTAIIDGKIPNVKFIF